MEKRGLKNTATASPSAEAEGIDYSKYSFCGNFENDAGLFPVNFLREFTPGQKKLKPTSRWNVTMVHPTLGICNFFLVKRGRNYAADTVGLPKGAQVPEKEIIDWCSEQLINHLE